MSWEHDLFALFDDLEARAEAEFADERDLEVADRAAIEYREVTWASRLHASSGELLNVSVAGVGSLSGPVVRTGAGWLALEVGSRSWIVFAHAVLRVSGLGSRSLPEAAWGVAQRLGPGSPLRALAESGRAVVVHLVDGSSVRGRIERVGADFFEFAEEAEQDRRSVVPWRATAAVSSLEEWGG